MLLSFLLILSVVLLAVGAYGIVAPRYPEGSHRVYATTLVICTVFLLLTAGYLAVRPQAFSLTLPFGLPWLGMHFRLDALSAFFLVVVNLGGAVASLFALGYGRHERAPERVLPFFPAFLAGMNLVLLADDAFSFLFAWEFMSLGSWALVMAHHRDPANARAGYLYLVMACFGTLALLLAFGLLAGPDGGYNFAAMRGNQMTPGLSALVLALALLGAGSKAGLVPLHVWLPLAHPAAPSHVSALMSGVMTKVAVYGFIRIVFDLLGEPVLWWWGGVVLAVGGITAVLGVLYALMQHDLKRLLAYHTVENIGIIFIGLGLALAFQANLMYFNAALALTAALFHVLNHSVFKSLLFLGTGAVLAATGERDMERLGGLIHPMPWTALAFLIGSAAISALPPLNGFVSEWLTFQAILISPELPQWFLKFLVPAVGALLALSAALAAACFVKAFGITFLGRPRSPVAAQARETDRYSLTAMFVLAGLCLVAGILPGLVIDGLAPVVGLLNGGARLASQHSQPWLTLVPVGPLKSSYNGLLLLLFMVLSAAVAAWLIHRFASDATRRGPAWDCGFPETSPMTQYTAGSFAQPIRRVFGSIVFQARERITMPPPGDQKSARLEVELHDPIWERLYEPLAGAVVMISTRFNYLQYLTIRHYLSLVFGALILLLLGMVLWR
ncbi:NADH/Ubiquinone/plastoquinone (Complex I) [Candidatus Competibacter denitrificans Run_A_D11]|uniref:NADH/Ubiquinone/plastoquinone (Complex I) n=1 Tax=Candidatus Competibacter denitrificans Run_A_D11 TaxID=1400863 RepID=W6M531_9GAMM|nr:hydrogenase 4 subunit B [Candidatus Competibacter denitrificans]CDI01734.1 NADH/Ubiquinone/plastoquinone (Complex I) [Candidatus Competibacter denitrificans Run_A_D11]HRC68892.1 hydrogenase 4 subunit B [Candidatus Competibacter denitrificans]